ncbi:biotin transporter BioY [Microbacterium sp. KUDC0406]|uniref:biotin transporter BioY n=1 Tax=Microbacterium sp. KUDC0406 TaxID=2909588 RepID=UPI001F4405B9|nr:biotin transporter BioY [Microbacterium sp. KUDC0406]UJP10928.1 biotin transporter BioY [Microbacterium sp. KUDC0406]
MNSVQEVSRVCIPRPLGADLARIAVFAALIVVLGMVVVPLPGGVPITAQTLGVMLAGLVLGARRGALAVLLVLALAAIGLPVLAGGRGGLGVFVGPSAGYLLGWVAGAVVIGLIAHRGRFVWWRAGLGAVVGGILVVYLFGIPVQALVTGVPLAPTALSSLAFLPGDLLKAAAATLLAVALHRAYPRAFESRAAAVHAV